MWSKTILSLVGLGSLLVSNGNGAEVSLVPVDAIGSHSVIGNEIVLTGRGQRVFLEIQVSGWDPDLDGSPELRAYQARIDSSGYMSGSNGTLAPAVEPCTIGDDCEAAFGTGSTCDVVSGSCFAGFIDSARSAFVFSGLPSIPAVDVFSLDYTYGATILFPPFAPDPGIPHYGGTLVLDVGEDALGTFTIGFVPASTFLKDASNAFITPLTVTPALVTLAPRTTPAFSACPAALTLLMLSAGTLVLMRRRVSATAPGRWTPADCQ